MPDGNPPALSLSSGVSAEGWLTDSWYFAAMSANLKPGRQFRRIILGQPVMLARTAKGEAFALRDICPHRLVPLSAGQQIDTDGAPTIQCPYHGWRFGTDGVCRHMPSLVEPGAYPFEKVRVRRYPVHEANGMAFVYVADNPRSETPPAVEQPAFDLRGALPKFVVEQTFNAHMDDAVVGLMDPAHVPFVHNQWWWRPPSTGLRLKEKPFEPIERGWRIARHQPSGNSLAYKALLGSDVTTEIAFQIPGFRWEIVEAKKARIFTLTCLTPVEPKLTRITQITYWTNAPLLDLAKPILIPAARKFLGQDGYMVDLQNTGMAYQKSMMWIDDIDVQAKWYLTLKKEWATSRADNRPFVNPIEPRVLRWRS
ncbi:MAG: aromatic ring-hydroxylating dioxygenase subunit alpha [Alphaproteobacteria bacterium]|nr:aromatic ring-hydroxylating dioxygenase subunit alpha [Alphaproteobacteria bacterium]